MIIKDADLFCLKLGICMLFSAMLKAEESPYLPGYEENRARSFLIPPLISTVLPGLDQFVEKQSPFGPLYSSSALMGLGLMLGFSNYSNYSLDTQNDSARMYQLGGEVYKVAGGLSAFHSFKTAVNTRKDFEFLEIEEKPADILLAPLKFNFFTKPTTYLGIPGILIFDLIIGSFIYKGEEENSGWHFKGSDLFFATTLSAGAGISEEAFFRGWLMPSANYYLKKPWLSNLLTALLFGSAHLGGENTFPLSQAVAGYYFGWVTQRNGWGIAEAVFIHTWVDVVAFLLGYATGDEDKKTLYLPITLSF